MDEILDVVTRLTNKYEGLRENPWQVSDAPSDYVAMQLKGIVGMVLHITELRGVRKLSQNKTPADRAGVIAGETRDNPTLAQHMVLATKRDS
jgi:transcriptional regulator